MKDYFFYIICIRLLKPHTVEKHLSGNGVHILRVGLSEKEHVITHGFWSEALLPLSVRKWVNRNIEDSFIQGK